MTEGPHYTSLSLHPTITLPQGVSHPSPALPAQLSFLEGRRMLLSATHNARLWIMQYPSHSFLKQVFWAVTQFKFWAPKQEC